MKNNLSHKSIIKTLLNFYDFYQKNRIHTKQHVFRYRIVTNFEEYNHNKLIQLAFKDNPGDFFDPMPIAKIKKIPDLIAGLHPTDVNSLNDLYYVSNDKIVEMKVEADCIIATNADGSTIRHNINDTFNPNSVYSTRLSYMVGYMQAERLMSNFYKNNDYYKIVKDNLTTLEIVDMREEKTYLRSPLDILFSEEYKKFSKEDVCKIGYICGQMSQQV